MYKYKSEKDSIDSLYINSHMADIVKHYNCTTRRSFRNKNALFVQLVDSERSSNTQCKKFFVYCSYLDSCNSFKNKERVLDHIDSIKFKERRGTYRFKYRRSLVNALHNLIRREDSLYYDSKIDAKSTQNVSLIDFNKFNGIQFYRFEDSESFFIKHYSNSHRFAKLLEVLKCY